MAWSSAATAFTLLYSLALVAVDALVSGVLMVVADAVVGVLLDPTGLNCSPCCLVFTRPSAAPTVVLDVPGTADARPTAAAELGLASKAPSR